MSNVDRRSELARTEGRNDFQGTIEREVTSWEGVTKRRGKFGTIEFRLGRHLLGMLPLAGLVDERTVIQRMRDAYERAQDKLDRGAGVTA
jgi:hypothetical protein